MYVQSQVYDFCYLSQQLGDNLDLLSPWQQVGQRNARHPGHLHVVDHTHQLLQQPQREVGVLQAVHSQTSAGLFITILTSRTKWDERQVSDHPPHV